MLLRFAFFVLGLAIFIFALQQLILPALFDRPILSLFREGRLERAQRLKAEALEKQMAAQTEVEAIQIEQNTKRLRDEALEKLTKGNQA